MILIPPEQLHDIEQLLGCTHQSLPITYLGMPLTIRNPARHDFAPLLRKLENRLQGWKARFISRAGKLQLVKSVLSTIPAYFMSCFKFPKWLLLRIDRIRRQFLWSRTEAQTAIHLVNWDVVCLPLNCGGMGITNLGLQNTSLMLRWLWSLFSSDYILWHKYATTLHRTRLTNPGPLILSPKGSYFWKSLLALRPLFHSCTQFKMIFGKQISFWFDGWAGQPLSPMKPSQPLPHRSISVHDARLCHPHLLTPPLTLQQHLAIQTLHDFNPHGQNDEFHWTISSSGKFSVHSVYRILSQGGKLRSPFLSVWKAKVTPTMRCFFFLLLINRILTRDVMHRRNLNFVPGCVMCDNSPSETPLHLFLQCPLAVTIWASTSTAVGFQMVNLQDTFSQTYLHSTPTDRHRRVKWRTTFITAVWQIWRERNERTFRHKRTHAFVLTNRILAEAELCLANC